MFGSNRLIYILNAYNKWSLNYLNSLTKYSLFTMSEIINNLSYYNFLYYLRF